MVFVCLRGKMDRLSIICAREETPEFLLIPVNVSGKEEENFISRKNGKPGKKSFSSFREMNFLQL